MVKVGQKSVVLISLSAMLVACAGTSPQKEDVSTERSREMRVAERADSRWAFLLKGDVAGAYDYLTPATKTLISRESYSGTIRPGMWVDAKTVKVICQAADLCTVTVKVSYKVPPRYGKDWINEREVEEVWRSVDSEWWYTSK